MNIQTIMAGTPCAQYFGKWIVEEARCATSSRYSRVFFFFRGGTVGFSAAAGPDRGSAAVYVDGREAGIVDLRAPVEEQKTVFEIQGLGGAMVHHLSIVALPEQGPQESGRVEITGFQAEEPVDYPGELRRRMEAEYKIIQAGKKEWTGSETWKPAAYKARAPERGVRLLEGAVRDLFDSNIANIKYCFTLPDYCEGEPVQFFSSQPGSQSGRGWSAWLPASNEGRMLAGAAQALRWEEDAELRNIVDVIIENIKKRMRDDGYYNYYLEEMSYAQRHYPQNLRNGETNFICGLTERKNYDRVFWTRGMIAAHAAGNPDALNLARRMYDWFNAALQFLPDQLLGGNATNGLPGGPLMYHTPAGKPEDIITSKRFLDQDYWMEALAERQPLALSHYPGERPHCYELLGCEAMADEYRATGEQKYLDALLGAWELYQSSYKHIGGAPAICEGDGPYPPQSYYLTTGHNGETCGSVFWIWINHRLAQLFPGEEKYPAEIEEAMINVMMACRTPKGYTRYHNRLHGKKAQGQNANTCCEVSSANLISAIPEYIYTVNDTGVYVNLFFRSELEHAGRRLRLETDFPYSGAVKIVFLASPRGRQYEVRLRIPSWLSGEVTVLVNGAAAAAALPGTYVCLSRVWKDGDTVRFTMPYTIRLTRYTGLDQAENNGARYALRCGPVLMALTGNFNEASIPRLRFAAADLEENLERQDELHFGIKGYPRCRLIPYFEVKEEQFTCFPLIG